MDSSAAALAAEVSAAVASPPFVLLTQPLLNQAGSFPFAGEDTRAKTIMRGDVAASSEAATTSSIPTTKVQGAFADGASKTQQDLNHPSDESTPSF